MEILVKNIASLVSSTSVVSTQMPMIEAAGDAPLFTNMKMVQDLGRIFPLSTSIQKRHQAIYKCPFCGNNFKTNVARVKSGETKSCGCYRRECGRIKLTTHGLCYTKIHAVWNTMNQRCVNPNHSSYEFYGARGIKVCDEWRLSFISFYKWAMGNGYIKGLHIDRINNEDGYSPKNCKWSTVTENEQHKRLINKVNTSGYRGVHYFQKKWVAIIISNGIRNYLGRHKTAIGAAQAYNNFVITHGTAHPLNIIK